MRVYCFECEKIWQQPDVTGEWLGECPHCGNKLYLLDPRGVVAEAQKGDRHEIVSQPGHP